MRCPLTHFFYIKIVALDAYQPNIWTKTKWKSRNFNWKYRLVSYDILINLQHDIFVYAKKM